MENLLPPLEKKCFLCIAYITRKHYAYYYYDYYASTRFLTYSDQLI